MEIVLVTAVLVLWAPTLWVAYLVGQRVVLKRWEEYNAMMEDREGR